MRGAGTFASFSPFALLATCVKDKEDSISMCCQSQCSKAVEKQMMGMTAANVRPMHVIYLLSLHLFVSHQRPR
jgi:hypothetical protein